MSRSQVISELYCAKCLRELEIDYEITKEKAIWKEGKGNFSLGGNSSSDITLSVFILPCEHCKREHSLKKNLATELIEELKQIGGGAH